MKPKTRVFIIVPILAVIMLIFAQCENKKSCKKVMCTMEFNSITIGLKYPDGYPVLLDSTTVFWKNENRFIIDKGSSFWDMALGAGCYTIVSDGMQKELVHRQEIMHFTGYLNGKIVCERDVLVGADCCHVKHLDTELPNQVIYGIPDDVRAHKFCELFNTDRMIGLLPSYRVFRTTIDENLPYEDKLQMIVDWLLSYSCVTDARIASANLGEIMFSFIKNGQTINMIMHLTNEIHITHFIEQE